MNENPDWNDIFVSGTQIRLKESGRITPGRMFEAPQTVEIVEVSEVSGKDGEWPASVTIRGSKRTDHRIFTITLDNLNIREAVERGDASILE